MKRNLFIMLIVAVLASVALSSCGEDFANGYRQGYRATTGQDPW